jgi:hypothetical protein
VAVRYSYRLVRPEGVGKCVEVVATPWVQTFCARLYVAKKFLKHDTCLMITSLKFLITCYYNLKY